jgi:hypothetical protein
VAITVLAIVTVGEPKSPVLGKLDLKLALGPQASRLILNKHLNIDYEY